MKPTATLKAGSAAFCVASEVSIVSRSHSSSEAESEAAHEEASV